MMRAGTARDAGAANGLQTDGRAQGDSRHVRGTSIGARWIGGSGRVCSPGGRVLILPRWVARLEGNRPEFSVKFSEPPKQGKVGSSRREAASGSKRSPSCDTARARTQGSPRSRLSTTAHHERRPPRMSEELVVELARQVKDGTLTKEEAKIAVDLAARDPE